MQLQKIRELIDVLMSSDLAELEFADGDHKLRLVRRAPASVPQALHATAGVTGKVTTHPTSQPLPAASPATPAVQAPAGQVTSPLYGIVHLTPAPDEPAFVQSGDTVKPGQVLCMVEAMKIFHEVKATCRARVEEVLVSSAQEVEAGESLFRLKPLD
jgi:acetyl-CoA carboxylase biotin carboxyl carrier protein